MKVSIGQIRAARAALVEIGQAKVPAPVAVRIALILQATNPAIQSADGIFNTLLAKHGTPHPSEPGRYDVAAENVPAFREEETAMNAELVELPLPERIHVGRLGNAEVSPIALALLDWMIALE